MDLNCNFTNNTWDYIGINMGLFNKRLLKVVMMLFCIANHSAVGGNQNSISLEKELITLKGKRDVDVHKVLYRELGRNSDTIINASNGLVQAFYQKEPWLAGVCLQLKSSLLFKQGNILLAMDAVDSSEVVFSTLNDTTHLARYHLIKGDIYSSIKDLDRSYAHLKLAAQYYSLNMDSSSMALSYLNLGNTFFYDEKFDSAYHYYSKISDVYNKPGSLLNYYQQLNIGNWHLHFKAYQKALNYFYPVEKGLLDLNYQYGLSFLYSNMADAYQGLEFQDSSLIYHRKAVAVCKEQKIGIHFINVSKAIASTFKELGQLDSALYYTELQMELNDSLLNMRINQEVNQKESENQMALHQKDMEVKNIALNKATREKWWLGIILLLISGFALLKIRSSKKEKEKNSALLQTNLELANTQEALKKAWIMNMEQEVASILKKNREKEEKVSPSVVQESPEKEEKRKALIQELEVRMLEGVYRKNDLTLESLSKSLKTNRTYLSESINKTYGKNFNSFVNEHRVNEARVVLMNNVKNYTIEAISQMVGFKSISVFNTAFKKQTGLTPSYFEKNAKTLESTMN